MDDAVRLRSIPTGARLSLRLHPDVASAVVKVSGLQIDLPINRCAGSDGRLSARIGPDEWLLIGELDEPDSLSRDVQAALGDAVCSVVDISHRNAAFAVEGPRSMDVLNGGCPLDLSDAAFPAGSATRTVFGKAQIVVIRPTLAAAFRVECWRSLAPYVSDLLQDLAREFEQPSGDRHLI